MPHNPKRDLWRWRTARDVRFGDRLVLISLCAGAFASVLILANWWFQSAHVANVSLYVLLSLVFWYGVSRLILGWINVAALKKPRHMPAPPELRVAIFTTSSPGEPLSMFDVTLAACARVRYPHTTYLLDDTRDPSFRECAQRHGAVFLELVDIPGAKAGKVNAALQLTSEDFILVLDPDHIPFPEMLERILGQFADDDVGFVQVVQAYYNQNRSFTARAAAEQTYAFYGPTQLGLFGHGAAVAIGANCTFRRTALESIGGHGIGLAEDLITSVRLHAQGWKSVYVPEIVSRGLVPEDLGSFYKQQLKWARGVYEVGFSELPHLFRKLDPWQRLAYLAIGTYYLFGLTMPGFLMLPYVYLWTGVQPAAMPFAEFILAAGPAAIIGILIYFYAQLWLAHPDTERGVHWRGMMLKIACWPVFLTGTVLAVLHVEIPYIPTAKEGRRGRFLRLAWPQLALLTLFLVTVARTLAMRTWRASEQAIVVSSEAVWGMIAFAAIAVILSFGGIYAAWQARSVRGGAAWDVVNVDAIGGSQ